MKRFLNSQFNVPLRKLKAEGLTWLPWVGKDYSLESKHRVLIVGESHYATNDKEDEQRTASEPYTQEVVYESLICGDWTTPTLTNLPKAFFGASLFDRETFWSSVGYYNFVQRLMRYVAPVERPSWNDFVEAWTVFERVVRILRPHLCIFVGVSAANSFEFTMNKLSVPHEPVRWHPKIGRVSGRTTCLNTDGHKIGLVFMQHAGRMFSWSKWNRFLFEQGGSHLRAAISKAVQR